MPYENFVPPSRQGATDPLLLNLEALDKEIDKLLIQRQQIIEKLDEQARRDYLEHAQSLAARNLK